MKKPHKHANLIHAWAECRRIDKKHHKRNIKVMKTVLEYYTTETFP